MGEENLTEVSEKVLQLTIELLETKRRKKAMVGGFNEEIKRIQKEIDELIYTQPTTEAEDQDQD